MMKFSNLLIFLNQAYPYYYGQRKLHQLAMVLLILTFGFTYFFEPFVVYRPEHKMHFAWICFIHGLFPAMAVYVYFTTINFFLKNEDDWTVGKEIACVTLGLLLIGLISFLKRDIIYNNPNNWSIGYLLEEIRNAYLVGSLFIIILVPLNFIRLQNRNIQSIKNWKKANAETTSLGNNEVEIHTQVKSDDFTMDLEHFLFAKSEGNYVEFFFLNNEGFKKELKRILIKDLEQQLASYNWIIKTHRSYLINYRKVVRVNGNAQGYQLQLKNYPETIPVSRGMIKTFKSMMEVA